MKDNAARSTARVLSATLLSITLVGFPGSTPLRPETNKVDSPSVTPAGPRDEQKVIRGNPKNYLSLLRGLRPGDTLLLEAGTYDDPGDVPGLPIFDLNGEPDKWIVISGPESGPRPVFLAREDSNTVRIVNSSYIVVRNLELDGRNVEVDAVKAQGVSHHITVENLLIKNHGADQGNVGISTKAPAWDWTIRGNIILGAGTGMYLGSSDGTAPFVRGLIEYNLIVDTIGYNLQIKHQLPRPDIPGMPTSPGSTTIRHNVFSKAHNGVVGRDARPNVLVGHSPLAGPGVDDVYQIYGNLFYENPSGEPLFQGEGNVTLYANVFFNDKGDAIWVQPHNAFPRMVRIFFNTIVARYKGILVRGGSPRHQQKVIGNAVFASMPILAVDQRDNLTGSFEAASRFLRHPTGLPGQLDFFPRPGMLSGKPIDTRSFQSFLEGDLDFNGNPRRANIRGAYGEEGENPGWLPKLEIKPRPTPTASPPK